MALFLEERRQDAVFRSVSEASGWSPEGRNDVRSDGFVEPDRLYIRGRGIRKGCQDRSNREQHHAQPAHHHRASRRDLLMGRIGKLVRSGLLIERAHLHLAGHAPCAKFRSAGDRHWPQEQGDDQPKYECHPAKPCRWPGAPGVDSAERDHHRARVCAAGRVAKMPLWRIRSRTRARTDTSRLMHEARAIRELRHRVRRR